MIEFCRGVDREYRRRRAGGENAGLQPGRAGRESGERIDAAGQAGAELRQRALRGAGGGRQPIFAGEYDADDALQVARGHAGSKEKARSGRACVDADAEFISNT